MSVFNYRDVVALNLRWMRPPRGAECRISWVEALAERNGGLQNFAISVHGLKISIPGELKMGDYAEFWAAGEIRVFDRHGVLLSTVPAPHPPMLKAGENNLAIQSATPATVKLTAITLGEALKP
jgi:hypothetical protein